jgi:signal transduction histidine kinase
MNSLPRFVGFSVLLLLAFLWAAFSAPSWLRRQTEAARSETIAKRAKQLEVAVQSLPRPREQWNDSYLRDLGGLVGGTVALADGPANAARETDSGQLSFDADLVNDGAPFHVRVQFPAPSWLRLLAVYQRATVGLLLVGAVLLWVIAFLAVVTRRAATAETGTRSPWQRSQAQMGSFEHLAKTSVEQREALHLEREERRRAEEDALLKQGLLNQSLEARIGLGRDLHDGIIQSLYAVGLTLEMVRSLVKTDPAEADHRLEQCCENLNNMIREVRSYITGLAPEHVQRTSFTQALESLLSELSVSASVSFDVKVDDEATALLTREQVTETLQIAREAVSNAIRHGGASVITLRVHKSDREICLLVQDNGTGFDAAQRRDGGHGLGNMHARAKRVGASAAITSHRGEGTRVVVTLPMLQSTSA